MANARSYDDEDVQTEVGTELDFGSASDVSNVGSVGPASSWEDTASRRSSKQSVRFFISEDSDDNGRDNDVGSNDGSDGQNLHSVSPSCNLVISRHRSNSWGFLIERGLQAVSLALDQQSLGNTGERAMSDVFRPPPFSNEENFHPNCNRSRSVPVLRSDGQMEKHMAQTLGKIGDHFFDVYSNRR